MLVATPVGGGHYFVDVIAGIAVAIVSICAARYAALSLAIPDFARKLDAAPDRTCMGSAQRSP